MKKGLLLVLLWCLIALPVMAQRRTVSGLVTEESSGEPLPGVSVVERGTNIGTVTNADGEFTLSVSSGATLRISFVGMEPQEVAVGNATNIHVKMKPSVMEMSELVVVGYGTQKKANLTGAVATVDVQKTLDSRPITDVGRGLQGAVAGLSITTTTGEIGTSPSIKIRGTIGSSNGTSNPLILVDNVVIPDLNLVNPDDIESISVLKDAASTAIYGARAAFGVILITTKSGKMTDRTSVSYSNNFAMRTPTYVPDQLPGWQQGEINLAALNRFSPTTEYGMLGTIYISEASIAKMKEWEATYGGQKLGDEMEYGRDFEFINNKQYYYRTWDWYKKFYNDWMPQQNHNLSISGGNGKTSYNIGLGYLTQNGMSKDNTDTYDRYNSSLSVNSEVNEWLSVRSNFMYTKAIRETPFVHNSTSQGLYDHLYYLWRWQPVYPYGTYNGKPFRSAITELQQANMDNRTQNYLRVGAGATITLAKGLTIDADFTYASTNNYERSSGSPVYALNFWGVTSTDALDKSYSNYIDSKLDFVQNINSRRDYYVTNAYATYEKTLSDHAFKVMGGTNIESSEYWSLTAKRMGLFDAELPEQNLAYGDQTNNSDHTHWSVAGFFGRINYAFKDRYLLEINGRYDGSSSFPTDSQWGFFPSVSAGYRLSEESFMEFLKPYLSSLKLRGSYGSVGNQDVGSNAFISTITMNPAYNWLINKKYTTGAGTPTAVASSLTWETVTTLDFGFDARLFDNKLGITFDWYKRNTKDILSTGETLPSTFGGTAPKQNFGELETPGWELSVDFNHQFSNGLRLNIVGQVTDYKTKVKKWNSAAKTIPSYNNWTASTSYFEGMVLGDIWGYKVDRLFQEDDFTMNGTQYVLKDGIPKQTILESGTFFFGPGDVKFKNLDDDASQISYGDNTAENHGDKAIIGNTLPRYQFSLRLGAAWKNFDFDVYFQGVGKRSLWVGGNLALPGYTSGEPWFEGQEDYWTPDNTDAFYPQPTVYAQAMKWNYQVNDRFLLNMAYLRCKTMTLGYTLPKSVLSKVHLSNLRVYVTGENLFEFTDKNLPIDPETDITIGKNFTTGRDASDSRNYGRSYPYQRVISLGLQLSL